MMNERILAKNLLNAVWDENIKKVRWALTLGADANWIFNGYPILLHAVFTRNVEMVNLLIDKGATQVEEALGFALDRGIGEIIFPLIYRGIVPKADDIKADFGPYPARYAPLSFDYQRYLNS